MQNCADLPTLPYFRVLYRRIFAFYIGLNLAIIYLVFCLIFR